MGMDVIGRKPSSKEAEYFRNNVWWWRPLWDYCLQTVPDPTEKVGSAGHYNDGAGLNEEDSLRLAKALRAEIDFGRTKKYEEEYNQMLKDLPDEVCSTCGGTGFRKVPPETGAGAHSCNVCNKKGRKRPWSTWYSFSEENVKEFVKFLEECGGFKIA